MVVAPAREVKGPASKLTVMVAPDSGKVIAATSAAIETVFGKCTLTPSEILTYWNSMEFLTGIVASKLPCLNTGLTGSYW
jgi:hypothetical protein